MCRASVRLAGTYLSSVFPSSLAMTKGWQEPLRTFGTSGERGLARDSKESRNGRSGGQPPWGGFSVHPILHTWEGTLGLEGRSVKNSWSQSDAEAMWGVRKGLGVGLRPNPHTQPMRTHHNGRAD